MVKRVERVPAILSEGAVGPGGDLNLRGWVHKMFAGMISTAILLVMVI